MKRNFLYGNTVLLTVVCFGVFSICGNAQLSRPVHDNSLEMSGEGKFAFTMDPQINIHKRKVAERINVLKGQTLDESFIELRENAQYFPGRITNTVMIPEDLDRIFSTRCFLKVFQQFALLPRGQAIIKLDEFCKRAIKEYDAALLDSLARNANPSQFTDYPNATIMSTKYMVCVTMLLAARLCRSNGMVGVSRGDSH